MRWPWRGHYSDSSRSSVFDRSDTIHNGTSIAPIIPHHVLTTPGVRGQRPEFERPRTFTDSDHNYGLCGSEMGSTGRLETLLDVTGTPPHRDGYLLNQARVLINTRRQLKCERFASRLFDIRSSQLTRISFRYLDYLLQRISNT